MKRMAIWIGAVLAGTLAVPAGSQQSEEAAERAKLAGTWTGFVVEGRGEMPDRGPARISELVIAATVIRARDGQMNMGEGSYRMDLSAKPRTLDAHGLVGPTRGKTYLGIYQLEGDTLRWCVANSDKPRPTEFLTRRGHGQYLMVFRRVPRR